VRVRSSLAAGGLLCFLAGIAWGYVSSLLSKLAADRATGMATHSPQQGKPRMWRWAWWASAACSNSLHGWASWVVWVGSCPKPPHAARGSTLCAKS